jgi:anti-anti-sigma regulatory factor
MIKVTKETLPQYPNATVIKMSGSIEETVNFEQLIGPPGSLKSIVLHCKEVSRINSVGVKGWIRYFQACQQAGVQIRLIECSTAIVEQINLISNFTAGGTVDSIYVPFACGTCKKELIALFPTQDLKKLMPNAPKMNCGQANCTATFDDIEEEYFAFLERES